MASSTESFANKIILGILGILAFIGSNSVKLDMSPKGERFIKSPIVRKLVVFSIAYIYARNWIAAITVTLIYIFVIRVFLYEAERLEAKLVDNEQATIKYV